MAVVIPPGFGLVAFKYSLTGDAEIMVHTLGFAFDPDTLAGVTAGVDDIDQAWIDQMTEPDGDTLGIGYTYLGVQARINTTDAGETEYETAANIVGNMAGAFLPNNSAILVRKLSLLGGNRNRGRMYLPPAFVPEGNISATGVLDGGQVSTLQTRIDAFLTQANSSPNVTGAVILHNELPTPVPAPTAVLELVVDQRIASQRRRLRR